MSEESQKEKNKKNLNLGPDSNLGSKLDAPYVVSKQSSRSNYNLVLSSDEKSRIQKELVRFESRRSATLPALYIVQESRGWISDEMIEVLAQEMGLPAVDLLEVRNFYTMFNEKPVGELHVQVCTNISCSMNGGRELAQAVCEKYKVKLGEVSSCGSVSVSKVECLGACDKAPMMQVNDKYHEGLTSESALGILAQLALDLSKESSKNEEV